MYGGHYWIDKEYEEYVAYSPTGKREYFEYNISFNDTKTIKMKQKQLARKAAYYWAHGDYKKSKIFDRMSYEQ